MGVKTNKDSEQEKENIMNVDNSGDRNNVARETTEHADKNGKNLSARPIYWPKIKSSRQGSGVRKARRHENTCFLLSLVDNEEYGDLEVSLADLVTSESAFEQLFENKESMEVWNEFVNRSGEEQDRYLRDISAECIPDNSSNKNTVIENHDPCKTGDNTKKDKRSEHPAHNPDECFLRINPRNRTMLRRRHIPKGSLEVHEDELVSWFSNDPSSVFVSLLPTSYDRLLLHSVCQYLDLHSMSFDSDGHRQTRVENYRNTFDPPPMLLSRYLDSVGAS